MAFRNLFRKIASIMIMKPEAMRGAGMAAGCTIGRFSLSRNRAPRIVVRSGYTRTRRVWLTCR